MVRKEIEHWVKVESRFNNRKDVVLSKADEIAQNIIDGWSPMVACRKAGGVDWVFWRDVLLTDKKVADALTGHLNRQYEKKLKTRGI